ncbi:MAG: hypothetical protein ABIG68_03260 [Acidobacteriota bacterium]
MSRKSLIYQCLKVLTAMAAAVILAVPAAIGQSQKPALPDPVKFLNKQGIVYNVVRAVLEDMEFGIELEDRAGGRIVTKSEEFITGSLTASEVDKVAVKNDSLTGSWLRARYSAEALVEAVSPNESLVTVRTRIEALNRELDGSEKWVELQSLGAFEKRILGKIGVKLLGNEMQFDTKKGFWDKSPQPVDPRANRPKPPPDL